jgi:hypothetical protein
VTESDAEKLAQAVSAFDAAATATLSNPAITGEPEGLRRQLLLSPHFRSFPRRKGADQLWRLKRQLLLSSFPVRLGLV